MRGNLVFKDFAGDTRDDCRWAEPVADIILDDKNGASTILLAADAIFAQVGKVNLATLYLHTFSVLRHEKP